VKHYIVSQSFKFAYILYDRGKPIQPIIQRWHVIVHFHYVIISTPFRCKLMFFVMLACVWNEKARHPMAYVSSFLLSLFTLCARFIAIRAAPVPYAGLALILTSYSTVFNAIGTPEMVSVSSLVSDACRICCINVIICQSQNTCPIWFYLHTYIIGPWIVVRQLSTWPVMPLLQESYVNDRSPLWRKRSSLKKGMPSVFEF
jgi:hypothetical protein